MTALDHVRIHSSGRKILKEAKNQRIERTMKMSEVTQLTGMTKEDLETFISCGLIAVIESAYDPVLSFRVVFCFVTMFPRFNREGMMV